MKTKTFLFAATFAIALLHAPSSSGQSNVVFYGANSNALSVAFVETNLSASVKASIVSDLRLCLQEWGKSSTLDLGAYEPGLAGYLYNPKKNPHYPENLDFPENLVSGGTGELILQIPKDLSTAYTNAFSFAAANSNVVAAAYGFVTFISSTNFHGVASNQISNYILLNQATPAMYEQVFPDITNSLRKQTFHPPSILGFQYSSVGPAPTNLWMRVPSSSITYGDAVDWGAYPSAIWHDGKWKFCVWEENPRYAQP